jgi:hypothetical protein|tara:strand:+ start:989 stop:1981 length:993 start_codon:yes stop_codon:yes gene_type:complete
MAVNKHFHTSNVAAIATEQNLYRDLVTEAIQIYGHDVFYIDRTLVAKDNILGEDSISIFRNAQKIEMYMENSDGGFAGEREIISQFGLENLSEATFVVSKKQFQGKSTQINLEDGTSSGDGGSILLEDGTDPSSSKFEGSDFYLIQETDATDSDRPLEGDAVYHPILNKLFQINFVDHDEPFFQLDNNPVFKLRCRLFDYSSEDLATGISDIDTIDSSLNVITTDFQFTLEQDPAIGANAILLESERGRLLAEDGTTGGELIVLESSDLTTSAGSILSEEGDFILQEDYILGDMSSSGDSSAQNELFDIADDSVLDFSETNPFGDVGGSS